MPTDTPTPDPRLDLPPQIVVGRNGAYWRDYGDHYSMAVVSEDNDPVEVVAVYKRFDASDTAWDRGFAEGLAARPAPDTGLDADTLNRAMWNVLDGQGRGTVIYPEDSLAIAAEYARLSEEPHAD